MKANGISRREVIAAALGAAALGGSSVHAGNDMAKQSTVPPGSGDGQLVAAQAIVRGYGGRTAIGTTFFEALGLKKREVAKLTPARAVGDPAELMLFNIHAGIGPGPTDPVKHFEAGFLRAARWLLDRPDGAFDGWREQGRRADVLVSLHVRTTQWGRIDSAPNLLVMPPKFLLACSGAGLPVVLNLFS